MDAVKLGALIARLRTENGDTQTSLAKKLNISNRTVSKWERGDGYPDITIIPLLAETLGVTTDELLACELRQNEEENKEIKPDFVCEFKETIKDWIAVSRKTIRRGTPLWMTIAAFICMFFLVIDFFALGETHKATVIGILFIVLLFAMIFTPIISGVLQYFAAAQMTGGKKQITKYTISDKIYIDEGGVHQEFDFKDITGIYEQKNRIIIKYHKKVYGYIRNDSFLVGDSKELAKHLKFRSSISEKRSIFSIVRIISVVALCIITLLCTIVTMLIAQ